MVAHTVTAALLVLPFLAQSTLATCARSYTVRPGDICDSISAANHVSTYQLAAVNPVINAACSNLMPGQTLCLGNQGEDCSTTHVVVPGDTCDGIIQAAGINSTMLYGNNPQINPDCSNIYVGEVLCTVNAIQVPPVPGTMPATTIPATAVPPVVAPPTPTPSPSTPPVAPVVVPPYPSLSATPSALPPTTAAGGDNNLPYCDEL